MERIIKSMENKYLLPSLGFVEDVFTKYKNSEEGKAVRQLVEEIRSKKYYLPELELIMVDEQDEVIGYAMFSRFHIEGKHENELLMLTPVAVKTELQRRHISKELLEYGFEKAKDMGYKAILVEGNPRNYNPRGFQASYKYGIEALLIYTLVSYLRLKDKISTAVKVYDNIYQSENVISPFVLGIIKPKIYLPFNIEENEMPYVIAHEQAHIRRKDHWWKPFGFLILTTHWFNPLVWLGYVLLCRDIELACDEKVVKEMNTEQRADYSQALLTCSVNRRVIAACPLAFGEAGVKDRVKTVLNYKKPAFWIIVVGIIASAAVAVCFLTNPASDKLKNIENYNAGISSIGGAYGPTNVITSADMEQLKAKFPMYFNLPASNGLEVYIWQMAEGSYSCGLLPNRVASGSPKVGQTHI